MTTARDVIAGVKILMARNPDHYYFVGDGADAVLAALLSAPESVRLELAWQLCPELRYPAGKRLPTPPSEDKT